MGQITEQDLEDMFDDALNEEGTVQVAGMEYYPSQILKKCDRIAYEYGMQDFAYALVEDGHEVEGY